MLTPYSICLYPRSITKLPIILKGILHPDDAKLGVAYGAKAIIVSNHGARQLDGVPASIDALPGKTYYGNSIDTLDSHRSDGIFSHFDSN